MHKDPLAAISAIGNGDKVPQQARKRSSYGRCDNRDVLASVVSIYWRANGW